MSFDLLAIHISLQLNIVHLYGTPYEMGVAHGSILKENVTNFINEVWAYLELQVVSVCLDV